MTSTVHAAVVSPPATVWGAQLYLLDQVEPLAERGVHLTLVTPRDTPFADAWQERGFPFRHIDLALHTGLREQRRHGPTRHCRSCCPVRQACFAAVCRGPPSDGALSSTCSTRSRCARTWTSRSAPGWRGEPVALDLVNIVRPGVGRTRAARRSRAWRR